MKIVIAGAGEVGSHLAKMLCNEENDITVIDHDEERLSALVAGADVITVNGVSSSIEVLKEAGCEDADLFIAVNPSDSQDVNVVSALLAKKLGSKKVTARIDNEACLFINGACFEHYKSISNFFIADDKETLSYAFEADSGVYLKCKDKEISRLDD